MDKRQKAASPPQSGIKSFLTYRLSTIHYNLDAHAEAMLQKHSSLSLLEWRIISIINHDVTTTLPGIIKISGVSEARLNPEVQSLIRKGCVVSSFPEAEGGVEREFSLSQSGKDLHNHLLLHMVIRQTQLTAQLTTQEMEALDTILIKLNDAALEMRRSVS